MAKSRGADAVAYVELFGDGCVPPSRVTQRQRFMGQGGAG